MRFVLLFRSIRLLNKGRIDCSGLIDRFFWVEAVAEAISKKVKGEYGEREKESGKKEQPWGIIDLLSALMDKRPPRCGRWLNAETKKADDRLKQDNGGNG